MPTPSPRHPQPRDDRSGGAGATFRIHGPAPVRGTVPAAPPAGSQTGSPTRSPSGSPAAPRVMVRRAPEGDEAVPADIVARYAARAAAVGVDTR
ncbi:MAG: hypothetical protein M3462_09960, partial [Chloroflexota bacterium]|nr:hypothetical protein [Chloroflexota bacterium]